MSGHVHWFDDVQGEILLDWTPPTPYVAVLEAATFDSIGDYTQSQPTGPSAGRIYRKNLDWRPDHPDRWYLYICRADPEDPKFTLHHPFKALIV